MTDQPPDLKAGLNCISKKFDLYQTSAKIQANMQNEIGLRYYSGKIKWIQILLFSAFFSETFPETRRPSSIVNLFRFRNDTMTETENNHR